MPVPPLLQPDWSAPPEVLAFVSTRAGGVSEAPYNNLNLAYHVGDDPVTVDRNRELLLEALPHAVHVQWLDQVHGTAVAMPLQIPALNEDRTGLAEARADAVYLDRPGLAGAVLTADCLPVFFADSEGCSVAVAHAGWRGLADGILERTLAHFPQPAAGIHAWLGPAIGPCHFEVGNEVRSIFLARSQNPEVRAKMEYAFRIGSREGKWMADLYMIARLRLEASGVKCISGGGRCTVCESETFFSYRHHGTTGRMASLIYIKPA